MRSGPAAIAALMSALALFLLGCGDEQTSAAGTQRSATHQESVMGRVRDTAGAPESSGRPARQCRRALGDFLDAMESLTNSVAVGVDYGSYLSAVNHVRSTYAPIHADDLSLLCLTRVASPAERALNAYIAAANAWGDCLATVACDPESIEPRLQREWTTARSAVDDVEPEL